MFSCGRSGIVKLLVGLALLIKISVKTSVVVVWCISLIIWSVKILLWRIVVLLVVGLLSVGSEWSLVW